jgi:hypothetical protein
VDADVGAWCGGLDVRSASLLTVVWIVIGIVVAASHHFFDHIGTIGAILSAIIAVILWPLILLGVKIAIVI